MWRPVPRTPLTEGKGRNEVADDALVHVRAVTSCDVLQRGLCVGDGDMRTGSQRRAATADVGHNASEALAPAAPSPSFTVRNGRGSLHWRISQAAPSGLQSRPLWECRGY